MLLQTLTLAAILLAPQIAPAEAPQASGRPTIAHQMFAPPAQPPQPAGDPSAATVNNSATNIEAREQQQRLLQVKVAELGRLQREIDQLRAATGTPLQILVKVQMLEVNLTKLRRLGVDFAWFGNGQVNGANGQAQNPATGLVARIESGSAFVGFIDALKQNNIAKPLAEPNVVVVSGRPASFNVGGEFPMPGLDGKPAEFRKFGTQLDLVALAMGNNQLRLEIRTRVSEIDDANAIVVNGARIPRLNVRECDTATQMSFGQTAVLTGLVEQRTESRRNALGLTQEEQIDVGMVVVVTPELVDSREMPPAAAANRDANGAVRK